MVNDKLLRDACFRSVVFYLEKKLATNEYRLKYGKNQFRFRHQNGKKVQNFSRKKEERKSCHTILIIHYYYCYYYYFHPSCET